MAPAVLRAGVVKAHLVFHAPMVLALEQEGSDYFHYALYIVAHECGHIEDLKHRDTCFPGVILQEQISDMEQVILGQPAEAIWEEYAACRLSAAFGGERQTEIYEECLLPALECAQTRAQAAIGAYRLHRDVNQVITEVGSPLCEPLRLAAYLLGHIDRLGATLDDAPQARDALTMSPYREPVEQLAAALRDLWSRRGEWSTRSEFESLNEIVRAIFAAGGIVIRRLPSGEVHVDIPFTPETMP